MQNFKLKCMCTLKIISDKRSIKNDHVIKQLREILSNEKSIFSSILACSLFY